MFGLPAVGGVILYEDFVNDSRCLHHTSGPLKSVRDGFEGRLQGSGVSSVVATIMQQGPQAGDG